MTPRYAMTTCGVVVLAGFVTASAARRELFKRGLEFTRWMKFIETMGWPQTIRIEAN